MTQVGFYFVAHFSASRHKHLFISSVQIDFWKALGFLWLQIASSVPIGERDATACITASYCVSLPQLRMTFSIPLGSLDYAIERGLQKRCSETDITQVLLNCHHQIAWFLRRSCLFQKGELNDSIFLLALQDFLIIQNVRSSCT